MANNDTYLDLRRMTAEVDKGRYTDTDLEIFIGKANGDLNAAAALIWREKAAMYAELVDTSEAGSSRKESDLYRNAIAQAQYFEGLVAASATATVTGSRTRPIVRA